MGETAGRSDGWKIALERAHLTNAQFIVAHSQRMAETDRALSAFAHVVAGVHPRPGREPQTVDSLRSRARELLERTAGAC